MTKWWREALVAATLVMAAFSWHDPLIALFAAVPVLIWYQGSGRRLRAFRAGHHLRALRAGRRHDSLRSGHRLRTFRAGRRHGALRADRRHGDDKSAREPRQPGGTRSDETGVIGGLRADRRHGDDGPARELGRPGGTRSDETGVVGGLVLLALAAWILLPRGLGLSGRWVPSVFEVCVFVPLVTVVICAGRVHTAGLAVFAVVGILAAGYTVVYYAEGETGDEGVWPGPSGLEVVEGDKECGSGGCSRQFDATGADAAERTRAYLGSRGFTTPGSGDGWMCRVTGLVLPYDVCAKVEDISPTTARVTWSI